MTTTADDDNRTEYTLQSAEFVSAPGMVRWAINGYAFKKDRPALLNVIASTWKIPNEAADALLSKRVPFTVTADEAVKFVF